MGVSHIDNVLMILGISKAMKENEREIITRELIKGFNDACEEAETKVTGGQSVMNPWPMIGGTAVSSVDTTSIIMPNNIQLNDDLILTKPLGTQVAVNSFEWLRKKSKEYEKLTNLNKNNSNNNLLYKCNDKDILEMYSIGIESMCRLNKTAAKLMKKYKSNGATDITGFGFKGHLLNLYEAQLNKDEFDFVITNMPLIRCSDIINDYINDFKLKEGYSPETSGGILLALNKKHSKDFIKEMNDNNECAWIVGEVVKKDSNSDNNSVIFRKDRSYEII